HQVWLNCLTIRLAQRLLRCPELRLLRDLVIETISDGSGDNEEEAAEEIRERLPRYEHSIGLAPLLDCPYLGNLLVFRLGLVPSHDDYQSYACHEHSSVVVDLVKKMPRLEDLYLYANGFDLTELLRLPTLSNLRILLLYHGQQVHRLHLLDSPTFKN